MAEFSTFYFLESKERPLISVQPVSNATDEFTGKKLTLGLGQTKNVQNGRGNVSKRSRLVGNLKRTFVTGDDEGDVVYTISQNL